MTKFRRFGWHPCVCCWQFLRLGPAAAQSHHQPGLFRARRQQHADSLLLIQSPQVEVLGITVVSGNQWRDEEVAHTLRLLEIMGRTDIPVVPGAAFPLVRRREETQIWQQRYGKVAFAGAWDDRWWHEPFVVPPLPEGQPTTKPADEDAAHFLIRKVHQFPHEVTIYEGGPMTNLALAISIDPQFPELAEELVFMGGSLEPADRRSGVRQQSASRI